LPTFQKLIAQNQTLKQRAVVPTYRAIARTNVFFPGPRVFADSFPKAGTHLLASMLGKLPRMMASGLHRAQGDYLPGDWSQLERELRTVNRGQYATGHFPHDPALVELLGRLEFSTLVCLRDPRDIAVSAVNYVMAMDSHDLHRRYAQVYSTFDERLMATIVGFDANGYGRGQPDIGSRVGRYAGWLDEPGTCVVRYEELIGPAGGGTNDDQRVTVARIAEHVGRPLDEAGVERVRRRVWSTRSSTFAGGRTGGWRDRFQPEHIEAFKRVCGTQLIDLGYEHDLDW
jgi:hypothetical protein